MKKLVWLLFFAASLSYAQNARFDSQATTTTGSGNQLPVLALPGAGIALYTCSGPAAASCTTLATTYTSISGGSTCPTSAQVVWQGTNSCTSTADAQGNFGAWLPAGTTYGYAFTITNNGAVDGPYQFTLAPGGTGSGTVTSFSAPSGNWPGWLTPVVTNPTTTPQLSVSPGIVPVQNGGTGDTTLPSGQVLVGNGNSPITGVAASTTVNGQGCALGGSCTVAAGISANAIACASTIAFSATANVNSLNLSCNVTSSSIPRGIAGACTTIQVSQVGSFTLSWPPTFANAFTPTSGTQSEQFCWDSIFNQWVGSGSISSVSAADSSLTVTPTTGNVTAKINTANSNAWTAAQSITAAANPFAAVNTITPSGTPNGTAVGTFMVPNLPGGYFGAFLDVGQALNTATVGYSHAEFGFINGSNNSSTLNCAFMGVVPPSGTVGSSTGIGINGLGNAEVGYSVAQIGTVPCQNNFRLAVDGPLMASGQIYSGGSASGNAVCTENGTNCPGSSTGSALGFIPILDCDGDSITKGSQLNYQYNVFGNVLANAWNGTCVNNGLPGSTSGGYDPYIFTQLATENRALSSTVAEMYTIGTNNVPTGTGSDLLNDYVANIEAQYVLYGISGPNLADTSYWYSAQASPHITYGGTWSNSTTFGANDPGKFCASGISCSATITFSGSLLYLTTGMTIGNTMTGTLTCDGTATGVTPLFGGFGSTLLQVAQTALFRVSLASGSHSCVLQSTSSTGTMYLEWYAIPTGTAIPSRFVMAGSIPNHSPDTNYAIYRALQPGVVSTLNGDGLTSIAYVNNTTAFTAANTANYIDGSLHPSDAVQFAMAQTYLNVANTFWGSSLILPPAWTLVPNGPVNFAFGPNCLTTVNGGQNNLCGPNSMNSLTSGSYNTAWGLSCLSGDTTGGNNTCIGYGGLQLLTTGSNDFAAGVSPLQHVTSGSSDIGIGYQSCGSGTTMSNVICMGFQAGLNNTGSGNILEGDQAGYQDSATVNKFAVTSDTGITVVSTNGGKLTTSILTEGGVFGQKGFVSQNSAYEIGSGNCNFASSLCFQGSPVSVLANGWGVPTYTSGTGVTSVAQTSGYSNTNARGELTIVGGTATTGTLATVNFGNPLSGAAVTSGGSGYANGDTVTFSCGGINAVFVVLVNSGVVSSLPDIITGGSQCATASGVSPIATSGSGTGLVVNVTAATPTNPGFCEVVQNGGATFYGLSHSTPSSSGFTISAANSVSGATLTVDYSCRP